MKTLITFFALMLAVSAPAQAKKSKHAKKHTEAPNKLQCSMRELMRKDCELKMGKTKVGLFQDKWRFDDGKWLANQPLPIFGGGVEWKQVHLRKLGDRTLVEMLVWGEPQGEALVQSLNWIVLEVGDMSTSPRVLKVVQRRRVLPARSVASSKHTTRTRYQADPMEKHTLELKFGKIHWSAGRKKGEF